MTRRIGPSPQSSNSSRNHINASVPARVLCRQERSRRVLLGTWTDDPQRFADGSAVVGYGSNPWITEHASDGTVTFSLSLGDGDIENGAIAVSTRFQIGGVQRADA